MKILYVPLWLTNAMTSKGLLERDLLNSSVLKRHFSLNDLEHYKKSKTFFSLYMKNVYGINLDNILIEPIVLDNDSYDLSNDNTGEQVSYDTYLLGVNYNKHESSLNFSPKYLTSNVGDDIIVIYGNLIDANEVDSCRFIDSLLKLFYDRNRSIQEIASSGLIKAYLKIVNQYQAYKH